MPPPHCSRPPPNAAPPRWLRDAAAAPTRCPVECRYPAALSWLHILSPQRIHAGISGATRIPQRCRPDHAVHHRRRFRHRGGLEQRLDQAGNTRLPGESRALRPLMRFRIQGNGHSRFHKDEFYFLPCLPANRAIVNPGSGCATSTLSQVRHHHEAAVLPSPGAGKPRRREPAAKPIKELPPSPLGA